MAQSNPFLKPFDTPRQTPPYSQINPQVILEGIEAGIAQAQQAVDSIVANPEPPTFQNTIVALERSGDILSRTMGVAAPLMSAMNDEEMMQLALTITPMLTENSTKISLNPDLWRRIKTVYDNNRDSLLDNHDRMLLENTYISFGRSGAMLEGDDRETFRNIVAQMADLTTKFGQNVQRELNTYKIPLEAADLDGLPQNIVDEAAELAAQNGMEGKYLFTLDQPTYIAFLKSSTRRDLREKMWRLYNGRNIEGQYSNLDNIKGITGLRLQLARLYGDPDFASHSLQRTMAGSPQAVYNLLDRLKEAYGPALKDEMEQLNRFARETEGDEFTIMPWDYSFYSNKLRQRDYNYDEEQLRPYFRLENVIDGVFGLANRLYGITFTPNPDIEVYHPDVKAFDVNDADGSLLGVLYTDFFPRSTKRPGAWMTNISEQWVDADGVDHRPVVSIVMNFTKPTAGQPSLLTPYEVETFLHEFGHSLHGLLAKGRYASLSGTNVYRDFVELPSQFNENFLTEKEFLDGFARHYQTGEKIPQHLIDAMVASNRFGAAYACYRQLLFGYLDMAWHTVKEPVADPVQFEVDATSHVAIFPNQQGALTSPQFSHIFSGGYAAGYYSYKWSEVLDADAFDLFRSTGLFNPATAAAFRHEILEKGGSENPAQLYRNFRGQDPSIEPLLRRDGIID